MQTTVLPLKAGRLRATRRLVHDALEQRSAQRRWQEQNHRRLQVIAKKRQTPLSAAVW